jgi:hypothetical protein
VLDQTAKAQRMTYDNVCQWYGKPCACGVALARHDTGLCEMCSVIPLELQRRDPRYRRPHSRCDCDMALVLPRSRIRGYCEECALVAGMPNPTADVVTEEQAIANVVDIIGATSVDDPSDID